jgi:hypothetical protein
MLYSGHIYYPILSHDTVAEHVTAKGNDILLFCGDELWVTPNKKPNSILFLKKNEKNVIPLESLKSML